MTRNCSHVFLSPLIKSIRLGPTSLKCKARSMMLGHFQTTFLPTDPQTLEWVNDRKVNT